MAISKIKSDSIDTIAATKLTGTITPSADAVTGAQIADNAINSEHYTDGSIDTAHIADVNVTTGKIADDAITLAKMAAGTDGNIISYDASGNPVAIATGTDGQVLTSTGAGSPPAFEALPSGGGLVYITKATASGSSTVDFLNNFSSTYDNYVIFMDGVIMNTENVGILHMRTVTGGSTVQTGAYYSYCFSARTSTAADNHHESDGAIYAKLQPVGTGTGTGENYAGKIEIYGVNEASNYTLGNVQYSIFGNAERVESGHGAFCWEVVTAVTGVQFVPNTGTISEGNFTLFGVVKS